MEQNSKSSNPMIALSLIRLQNEEKKIKEKIANRQFPANIKITPVIENNSKNLFKWNLEIKGRGGTLWEGGTYRFLIEYQDSILKPPIVTVLNKEFRHIHLYEDKKVCLGIIAEGLWNAETPLYMIATEIEDLIHREPNLTSPADYKLGDIYYKTPEEYDKIIKEVAKSCQ